jgi:hypothetical protein
MLCRGGCEDGIVVVEGAMMVCLEMTMKGNLKGRRA